MRVDFPLLTDGVAAFLHGGSPVKVWQPDSFRIRLNRRSTFNYRRDILRDRALRQIKLRGLERVDWFYRLTIAAYHLVRMRRPIPIHAPAG